MLYDLGELVVTVPDWHLDAVCREHPEIDFFPERGGSTEPAKRVCEKCLVRYECLAFALEQGPLFSGIWGGTSRKQRADALKRGIDAERIIRTMGLKPVSTLVDIPSDVPAVPDKVPAPEPAARRRKIKYGDAVAYVDGVLQAVPDPVDDEPPMDAPPDVVFAWINRRR